VDYYSVGFHFGSEIWETEAIAGIPNQRTSVAEVNHLLLSYFVSVESEETAGSS
jgi:hypothetical protein